MSVLFFFANKFLFYSSVVCIFIGNFNNNNKIRNGQSKNVLPTSSTSFAATTSHHMKNLPTDSNTVGTSIYNSEYSSRRDFFEEFITRCSIMNHYCFASVVLSTPYSCLAASERSQQLEEDATTKLDQAGTNIATSNNNNNNNNNNLGVNDQILASLVFERILGTGRYKTVYLVTGTYTNNYQEVSVKFALSVQRLRVKSDVKDAFQGLRIVEQIQNDILLTQNKKNHVERERKFLFEQINDWWIQKEPITDFSPGKEIFSSEFFADKSKRVKKPPKKNFLGSQYFITLKPLYDMDLKTFMQSSPALYPIYSTATTSTTTNNSNDRNPSIIINGIPEPLTEELAVSIMTDLCYAGKIMHEQNIVHRDIKPKNIMIDSTSDTGSSELDGELRRIIHPVIIDFGFADIGDTIRQKNINKICVEEPGRVRGEVRYVLSEDVAVYRGCQQGDLYAMGKTMYELFFGDIPKTKTATVDASTVESITEEAAQIQNAQFRQILFRDNAGKMSRFILSSATRDVILHVIRGLCKETNPISFKDALHILSPR